MNTVFAYHSQEKNRAVINMTETRAAAFRKGKPVAPKRQIEHTYKSRRYTAVGTVFQNPKNPDQFEIFVAYSVCSNLDNFDKELGFYKAFMHLQSAIERNKRNKLFLVVHTIDRKAAIERITNKLGDNFPEGDEYDAYLNAAIVEQLQVVFQDYVRHFCPMTVWPISFQRVLIEEVNKQVPEGVVPFTIKQASHCPVKILDTQTNINIVGATF